MMEKRKLVIAVTGLNNIDSPGPGIPVIRALRECDDFDVRIIGLSYESLEPGIYMKEMVDKTYQIPYPSAGTEMLLSRLLTINDVENIDLVIPNFDAELYNFIKIADKLKDAGIASFLPTVDQLDARDKINLYSFGQKFDFKVPEDKTIYSVEKISEAVDEFEFPKFNTDIYQRTAYRQAAAYGSTVLDMDNSKAKAEINNLVTEIQEILK